MALVAISAQKDFDILQTLNKNFIFNMDDTHTSCKSFWRQNSNKQIPLDLLFFPCISNYERIHSKVAKVNKLTKIDANENNDNNEGNLSPRSWFRKNKKDMTMPNNGLSKSKSSSNNVARWDIFYQFLM